MSRSADRVTVQFLKYPDAIHWGLVTYRLGEDEWGVWLGMPVGSERWKGAEPWHPTTENRVLCVPHSDWWVLSHNGAGPDLSHFVDISTPAVWGPGRVEMVDLDLDVVVWQDGTVEMEDEDEFALHQVQLDYPGELVAGARAAADRLFAEVSLGREPFFATAASWLLRVGTA